MQSIKNKWCSFGLVVLLFCVAFLLIGEQIKGDYHTSQEKIIPENAKNVPFNTIQQNFVSSQAVLTGLELLFENLILEDSSLQIKILRKDVVVYASNINVNTIQNGIWKKLYTNIPLTKSEYSILISAEKLNNKPSAYIVTKNDSSPENTNLIVDGIPDSGSLLLLYEYKAPTLVSDRIMRLFASLIIALTLYQVIININSFFLAACQPFLMMHITRSFLLFGLLEFISCYLVINLSSVEFQPVIKGCLYLITGLTMLYSDKIIKYIRTEFTNFFDRLALIVIVLVSGFFFVGNQSFAYPVNKSITIMNMLYFIVTCLWVFPLIILILIWYSRITITTKKYSGLKFLFFTSISIIGPSMIALYAFNPAISSPDTRDCLDSAHHIKGMVNWHPPFYVLLLKVLISIWDSPYTIVLFQLIFWVFVVSEMLLFLRERGVSENVLLLLALMMGFAPSTFVHLVTIWKDIPYTISLLWLSVILSKFILKRERGIFLSLEFIAASVLTFFLRQNGMVVLAFVYLTLIMFNKKIDKYVISNMIISIVAITLIRFPLYSYMQVKSGGPRQIMKVLNSEIDSYMKVDSGEPRDIVKLLTDDLYSYVQVNSGGGGKFIGLGQDILGIYYANGIVSEDTMQMVNVLTTEDVGQYPYNPYYAYAGYSLNVSIPKFLKNYVNTAVHNPGLFMKVLLLRTDCVWDIFGGINSITGTVNYITTMDSDIIWSSYYPQRKNNKFTQITESFLLYFVENQLLNIITWKSGLATWLVLLSFYLVLKKKEIIYLLIFTPFIGQIISLVLTTGWADFRYYWPLNIMAFFLLNLVRTIRDASNADTVNEGAIQK